MSFLAGQAGLVLGLVGPTDGRFDFLSVPLRWLAHGFCTDLSLQVLFASLVWASWGRACRVLVQNENSILMEVSGNGFLCDSVLWPVLGDLLGSSQADHCCERLHVNILRSVGVSQQ